MVKRGMLNWLALMVGVKGATLDFYCEVMQLSLRLRNEKEQVGKFGSGVKKKKMQTSSQGNNPP